MARDLLSSIKPDKTGLGDPDAEDGRAVASQLDAGFAPIRHQVLHGGYT